MTISASVWSSTLDELVTGLASRMKTAVFRCDASAAIGFGHLARCLPLAAALRERGWRTVFAISESSAAIAGGGAVDETVLLPDNATAPTISALMEKSLGDIRPLLVIDHYISGADFAESMRACASEIITFSDAGDDVSWANVLIDMTPPDPTTPVLQVANGRMWLRGPGWAPMKPAFAEERVRFGRQFIRREHAEQILIALGATDPMNLTGTALTALREVGYTGRVGVALTSAAANLEEVREVAARLGADLHVDHPAISDLVLDADLVIGGCGVSSWERATLGRPSVGLCLVDNQQRNATALAREAAALVIDARHGLEVSTLTNALRSVFSDPEMRLGMGETSAALTDGSGARRLAIALDPVRTKTGRPVRLRPARLADTELMFTWQSEPGARRFSSDPRPPVREKHVPWVARKLQEPGCIFSIICVDTEDCGLVRLDRRSERDYEVSILISAAYQGEGIATAALAEAAALVPDANVLAFVMPDNASSRALFARAGFEALDAENFCLRSRNGLHGSIP